MDLVVSGEDCFCCCVGGVRGVARLATDTLQRVMSSIVVVNSVNLVSLINQLIKDILTTVVYCVI